MCEIHFATTAIDELNLRDNHKQEMDMCDHTYLGLVSGSRRYGHSTSTIGGIVVVIKDNMLSHIIRSSLGETPAYTIPVTPTAYKGWWWGHTFLFPF